ncbi:MAG TPA: DUF1294 domain-containing protein [Phycisphaerales bacterium]|nr:DUF1294 domain-containing protein [Phycisphaerales bacterium]
MRYWLATIFSVYVVMSVVTFVAYWSDKRASEHDRWRIRERMLHLMELFGGWPGALAGQRMLHHKSSKRSFRIVLWLIVLLHVCAWVTGVVMYLRN